MIIDARCTKCVWQNFNHKISCKKFIDWMETRIKNANDISSQIMRSLNWTNSYSFLLVMAIDSRYSNLKMCTWNYAKIILFLDEWFNQIHIIHIHYNLWYHSKQRLIHISYAVLAFDLMLHSYKVAQFANFVQK